MNLRQGYGMSIVAILAFLPRMSCFVTFPNQIQQVGVETGACFETALLFLGVFWQCLERKAYIAHM